MEEVKSSRGSGAGWAALEGANRAALASFAKLLGEISKNAAWATLLAVVYGAIQSLLGFRTLRAKRLSLRPASKRALVFYLLFAVGAVVNTTLGIYIYAFEGADIAVSTFLRTFSMIFAAPIAWVCFNERLTAHQMLGILVFLTAGWCFVGMPSLEALTNLPVWMWLSLVIAVFAAVNELATSAINREDKKAGTDEDTGRARYNFWIGLFTFSMALPVFAALLRTVTAPITVTAMGALLFLAIGVVIQLNWRYIAYTGDAQFVVIKKFFTTSVYFILAALFGILFHHEAITVGKIAGVPLALVAFLLLDKRAFQWMRARVVKQRIPSA